MREAHAFRAGSPVAFAPASWEAELVHVVWRALRAGVVDREAAVEKLRVAAALDLRSQPVAQLWEGALGLSMVADHPPYNMVFVKLAERMGIPLVTFDEGLLRRFPEIARRPRDIG